MKDAPYTARPITPADVSSLTALRNTLAAEEGDLDGVSEESTARLVESEAIDFSRASRGVFAGDELAAYAYVHVRSGCDSEGVLAGQISGGVAPEHRGRGLGRELMDWAEPLVTARLKEASAARGDSPVRLVISVDASPAVPSWEAMLARRGYAHERAFARLELPLAQAGERTAAPAGIELRSAAPEDEAAVLQAHLASFGTHWGMTPMTRDDWHRTWTGAGTRLDLTTLAWDNGEVVGFSFADARNPRSLHVTYVGTIPRLQGRGVAAATLTRTIDLARREGSFEAVDLTMETQNPTAAPRLYAGLGFCEVRRFHVWRKDV